METIDTEEALRAVIGEEIPGLGEKNEAVLNEFAVDFIARSPFLVLSTADAQGRLDASPKGDAPGFVAVEDERTLLIPDRLGNRLAYGHRNILANPHVGVLFMIPGTTETLRVNGTATLTADPDLLERLAARGRPAVLVLAGGGGGGVLPLLEGIPALEALAARTCLGRTLQGLVRQDVRQTQERIGGSRQPPSTPASNGTIGRIYRACR